MRGFTIFITAVFVVYFLQTTMAYEQEYEHEELENYSQIDGQPAKSVQFPYCLLLCIEIFILSFPSFISV